MYARLTPVSRNRKTGPIPVSTTERSSCPPSCGLHKVCYGLGGPVAIVWRNVSQHTDGKPWPDFCGDVRRLPKRQLWRHDQVGDLPGSADKLDRDMCLELSEASAHTRGFTYTHYPTTEHNNSVVAAMNRRGGMTVNLSADSLADADRKAALGIAPVTVVIPSGVQDRQIRTPAGRVVVKCPADHHEDMTCLRCQLCQVRDRKSVVGFSPKGMRKRALSDSLLQEYQ